MLKLLFSNLLNKIKTFPNNFYNLRKFKILLIKQKYQFYYNFIF